jgi:hypothetical protein
MNNDDNICCFYFNKIDEIWEENKYKISGKFAIGLSVLTGIASILSIKFIIPVGIILGITNVGVFFAGLSLEKFKNEHIALKETNESLQNEKNDIVRRYTNFQFPIGENTSQTPCTSIASTNTHYEEPISFSQLLNRDFSSTQKTEPFAAFSNTT